MSSASSASDSSSSSFSSSASSSSVPAAAGPSSDALTEAFFALHHGLPRQGPGSAATTRRLFRRAGPLPAHPRVLDVGCGPGRSALLLAAETGAHVTCVDLHRPFLDELTAAAARRGLGALITAVRCSMDRLPFPDHAFDLVWSEGSAYVMGFEAALRSWRRLVAPGGALVVTEPEWSVPDPSPRAPAFWNAAYPLRTAAGNTALAEAAGYRVDARLPQPDGDWWAEYYDPLAERIAAADLARPGMDRAVAAAREEIALRRDHGGEYQYTAYVLRPRTEAPDRTGALAPAHAPAPAEAPASAAVPAPADAPVPAEPSSPTENGTSMTRTGSTRWAVRPEAAGDAAAVRAVHLAAFPSAAEADLVDALREDPGAWLDGLSLVAEAPDGTLAGHALLTRCHVGGHPALALAPVAVLPGHQGRGAGSAVVEAGLDAAREAGEDLVVVLGHPGYYPRFGFAPACRWGIRAPFEVPDEAMMALPLDPSRPVPGGTIQYPAAFGV
ncbi:transferase [Streptomyces sp. Ru73]|uniref:bifunctional class I SAM-dependent methyltransferase/N-acetyltransferase n=1 Tax=Streptomyces sp. Ru73 TaxID=2080748 RepID=UPI000CDDEC8D|nr:bifunctional class I SAM-dependent methyltransferase/N-acetyltransferase [Streptomyces sp. Ru73]POX43089.1 transferase [Streptomyces sp. Ru73]